MAEPDIRFRTYLSSFLADMLTRMSGPLSVPLAALALWVSSRGQKILWGCLAVFCAVFSSYLVWRKQRILGNQQLETLRSAKDEDLRALSIEKEVTIAALNERVAELTRKPFSEDLERSTRQVLDQMTHPDHLLLRHLLMHQPIEVRRPFMREIPIERQNEQMAIAFESGLVRHDEERQGPMVYTCYIVSPQHQPVLQKVLYDVLQ